MLVRGLEVRTEVLDQMKEGKAADRLSLHSYQQLVRIAACHGDR